jgi:hypothetical protein
MFFQVLYIFNGQKLAEALHHRTEILKKSLIIRSINNTERALIGYYPTRNTHDHSIVWYIPVYHGIRTNSHIIANGDSAEDLGSRTDITIIAECRDPLKGATIMHTYGHTLADFAILADHSFSANSNTPVMAYVKPARDFCFRRDIDSVLE